MQKVIDVIFELVLYVAVLAAIGLFLFSLSERLNLI